MVLIRTLNPEGWAFFLSCRKMFLENGSNLKEIKTGIKKLILIALMTVVLGIRKGFTGPFLALSIQVADQHSVGFSRYLLFK